MSNPVPMRQVVSLMLYNARGEVLLQLRDDKPTIPYPDQWTLFGGQVEPGEPPEDAAHRELQEELGVDVPLVLWREFEDPDRTKQGEIICMHYSYSGAFDYDVNALTLSEGQRMAFYGRDEAANLDLAFGQTPLLLDFFAELSQS
jgi:8-oxo-dGTP diphosphatase